MAKKNVWNKPISRRRFIQGAALGAAATALPIKWIGSRSAYAFYQTPTTVPLFGTTLRGIGQIPVCAPDLAPAPVTGVLHYTININQFQDPGVCPALGPTTLRGFSPNSVLPTGAPANAHLGGILVGQKGTPIQLTFRNNLPAGPHIIPNDLTIPGANQGNNRTAIHFHGGLVPWISDGGPFDWWEPAGTHGASFLNNLVLNPAAALNEAEYYYPLNQSARFGWYHDHAYGITRINAYGGIASGLIIRDLFESNLVNQGLPNYIELGGNEIPLVFQDKIFVGPNINAAVGGDPTWAATGAPATPGSLWYAHTYERNRWRLSGNGGVTGSAKNLPLPDPSCIPEFFGDTMLVNGTTFPKATVEGRRYRLRLLNACNARFLNLQLYVADGSLNGITLDALGNPTNAKATCDPNTPGAGNTILQVGTEGGFLPYPVKRQTGTPFNPLLPLAGFMVAPAERPDLLVDFSAHVGKSIILYNDAPAPFPVGDPRNDYFPNWNVKLNPLNALTPNGFGPNSRVLMRFDVVAPLGAPDAPLAITTASNLQAGNDPLFFPYTAATAAAPAAIPNPAGVPVRSLTLNETFDAYGRLEQRLGTNVALTGNSNFGRAYIDPITEAPIAGTTEVWEIYNLTADVHPMHFHLVNVQLLSRQPFQNFNGTPTFKGPATGPEANETGWKETVMMFPGTVTRIMMKFDLTGAQIRMSAPLGGGLVPTPSSPRTGGAEYVWHCHILEHEEHDMMRPLVVL